MLCFARRLFLSGQSLADPNVVRGIDKAADGKLGSLDRLVPRNLVWTLAHINGRSGLINYLDGVLHSVLAIDTKGDKSQALFSSQIPKSSRAYPRCRRTTLARQSAHEARISA